MSTQATAKCPKCGTLLRISVDGEPEGQRIRCGACERVFVLRRRRADSPSPPSGSDRTTPLRPSARGAVTRTAASPAGGSSSPDSDLWRFEAGDRVADRYRVVRRIARGGMGEVYEAEDRELEGRVALKTIRPERAREKGTLERFRREIQLARQVTHPNVCRIFDVSYHPAGGEGTDGGERVIFLTMELLRGRTLTERLAAEGPLPPEEALPLARQLASALDAAHAAGVIHRDLKSNNVMLVPGEEGPRAVITDFGLARGISRDGGLGATLALGGATLGTPDYLAPEQVEDGEVTAATDLYAFGLVLYEMVTGRLPFSGDTPLAAAVQRVQQEPPSPRRHVPELDAGWEAAILGCLERRPEDRFARAAEVIQRIEAGKAEGRTKTSAKEPAEETAEKTAEGAPQPPARRKSERGKVALLVALVLVAVGVGIYQYREWKARSATVRQVLGLPADQPLVARRAVAVLGLDNLSGDPDAAWLGTAIAEMLRTELRAAQDLRLISGDEIARMEVEAEMAEEGSESPSQSGTARETDSGDPAELGGATLQRVHRVLGADYAVTGSYTLVGASPERQIRLDLQLQDALDGELLASEALTGREGELFDLVARAGDRLRERLGAEARDEGSGLLRRAALPATPEAARLYSEGLEEMRRFEPLAAKDRFEQAAEIEPNHPLIHSALALAWSTLGHERRAREEARQALELSDGLPAEERLSIEARYFEIVGDWERAVETWRNLWALYPDNAEYGLRLAASQTQAGRPRDALTTTAALRSLPEPAGEDLRIDLAEASAAAAVADVERHLAAARRAATKGRAQGSRLLVARARLAECRALLQLGRPGEARAACDESRRIYTDSGDRAGRANALNATASILYARGDLAGARELFEQALDAYREMGNQGAVATMLNNLAVVRRNQGELDRARRLYEEGLTLFRRIGNRRGEATALNNLAAVRVRLGDLSVAKDLLEEALEIQRDSGDRPGEASTLDQLGEVLRLQGRLAEGRQRHQEALRLGREIGLPRHEVVSLNHLAEAALEGGDLERTRELFEQSLARCREIGYRSPEASALFGLAQVDFERGDAERARQRHLEALSRREELGEQGAAAESRTALARVLLETGEPEEAEVRARNAAEAFGRQGSVDREAGSLTVLARALRAQGRTDEAREALRRVRERIPATEDLTLRLRAAIERARLATAGPVADREAIDSALATLERAVQQARASGHFGLELEARLAALEVLLGGTVPRDGREIEGARLDAELLATDAQGQGFERLAEAAERLVVGAGGGVG